MKQLSKSKSKTLIKPRLKKKLNTKYHNLNKFFSYPEMFMALIDGGRGVGKTTGGLIQALINCDKDEEFVYLRRYKPEIKKWANKDSFSPIIDGVRYVGDGTGGFTAYLEDKKLGYLISLSTARSYKSVDFSKVTLILFDEGFVRQTSSYRYLQDECVQLLEFISTVVRTRTNVRVVIYGNHEDMFSPYHSYFEIPPFEQYYIDNKHGIYCEHVKNSAALIEEEKKTGLFHLIKDTAYGDYHYENKLLTGDKVNIIDKPSGCRIVFRVITNGQTCNIYTYNDKENNTRLYCEHKEKVIKDTKSYEIINNGKYNYLDIDLFKNKAKKYLYFFYFHKGIDYSNEKGGAIISWVIENT